MKGMYKHENGRDLVIEVLKSYDVHPDYIKIKYRCWNIATKNEPFLMTNSVLKSKLYKKDLQNWSRYDYFLSRK